MSNGARRPMTVSSAWVQGMLLTFVIGFAILGYLALRVYEEHAPVPARVVDEAGKEVLSGEDIIRGQEAFLTYGLMQFGSVYGHGAYLGPDFTADYLHRQAELMRKDYGGGRRGGRARPPGIADEPLRPGVRHPGLDRRAGPCLRGAARALRGRVPQPQTKRGRAGAAGHPRPRRGAADHGLRRLDRLDGGG